MSARSKSYVRSALLAVALAWPAPVVAQACDAAIVPISPTLRLDYDPFAFARTVGRMTFEVESRAPDSCEVDLVLLDSTRVAISEKDVGLTGVLVAFSAGAGDAALTPTAVPGTWRVRIEPGRRTKLSLDGIVSHDAVATAGEHVADLTLELRDVGAVAAHGAAMPVRIVLAAIPRAQMNIVGVAATFGQGPSIAQVDFGVFESNASRRVFLQVRANSRARLTIDSANLGRLLLDETSAEETGIPYSVRFGDEPVDLTHHWEKIVEPPRSIAGSSLPLDLVLGTIGAHVAGRYSDTLTIELSAL